jgi:hypothetical protein
MVVNCRKCHCLLTCLSYMLMINLTCTLIIQTRDHWLDCEHYLPRFKIVHPKTSKHHQTFYRNTEFEVINEFAYKTWVCSNSQYDAHLTIETLIHITDSEVSTRSVQTPRKFIPITPFLKQTNHRNKGSSVTYFLKRKFHFNIFFRYMPIM